MEHNTDRILWTVLILSIGVALFVIFKPATNQLLGQTTEKIQDVVNNVNGNKNDSSSNESINSLVDKDDNSPFTYQYDTNAKTATITGYNLKSGDDLPVDLKIPAYKEYNGVKYTVTSIGDYAFQAVSAPSQGISVTLPDTIKTIGNMAFQCEPVTSINLPEGLVSINDFAFSGDKLTNVTIPSTLETIGTAAFCSNATLTSVDMSNATSLTSISDKAFGENQKLASLKLPLNGKLNSIGGWSFYKTALSKIEIPASVTKIGYKAFCGTAKGASVIIHSPNGSITYVVDLQGTTSTTPSPLTFAETDNTYDDFFSDVIQ